MLSSDIGNNHLIATEICHVIRIWYIGVFQFCEQIDLKDLHYRHNIWFCLEKFRCIHCFCQRVFLHSLLGSSMGCESFSVASGADLDNLQRYTSTVQFSTSVTHLYWM